MRKKKKLAVGGRVTNYVKDPNQVLQELDIAKAGAMLEAETDPLANLFGMLSMAAPMVMGSIPVPKMAMGGGVGNVPVEVEGDEVAELPNQQLLEFMGPSHEQGGIDVDLPEGTEVFSDRIQVEGKTMAQRKLDREKRMSKMEKIADKKDPLAKNALKRITTANNAEEIQDKNIQTTLQRLEELEKEVSNSPKEEEREEFATGGPVIDRDRLSSILNGIPGKSGNPFATMAVAQTAQGLYNPYNTATPSQGSLDRGATMNTGAYKDTPNASSGNTFWDNLLGSLTPGDITGITGNIIQAVGPLRNTLRNRAGDTPNVNSFRDFGQDGLNTIGEAQGYVEQQRDNALQDLELSRNAAILRNRNSARSVNTMRSLDLATDSGVNNTENQIRSQFSNQMLQLLSQQAGMENQQDSMVMQGEGARDLADRQDRDNFYSNYGQDLAHLGEAISGVGRNLNQVKERNVTEELLNKMFGFVEANMMTGEIKGKAQPKSTFKSEVKR